MHTRPDIGTRSPVGIRLRYMENSFADHPKAYANFERRLTDWTAFEKAATSTENHWFKDLLSLWRSSGQPSGKDGLRLAIRNNYLNFYRLGQSVARVYCVRGELHAEVHYKYVLGAQSEYSGPLYLRLTKQSVFSQTVLVAPYEGLSTLHKWIVAAQKHVGHEKKLVDQFIEKNDNVLDMEMALPAWAKSKVAVRMDLVAIEDGKLVFWEVKTVNDSRIRCRAAFKEDELPEVLKQLKNYRVFLADLQNSEQVKSAYQETAKRLVALRKLANTIGPTETLGPSIIAVSKDQLLTVADRAALVVVDLPLKGGWKSWKDTHERVLLGKIPMRVLAVPGPLKFEGAQ
jgi:hypothetical protein